jgi:hypothetical protein
MRVPNADVLLFAWECGRNRHPLDRALLLYSIAAPESDPDALADRHLGQRNAALLQLRESMFGDALSACVDCPHCGERLEFSLSAAALRTTQPATAATHVEADGLRFRLPTTRDLARIAGQTDAQAAAQKLVLSLLEMDQAADDGSAAALVLRLAAVLERADPRIDCVLDLNCPACEQAWTASFDIAGFLWEEIEARARRLLDEVHVLARAYSWPEREILSLSETRRAAYLERVVA